MIILHVKILLAIFTNYSVFSLYGKMRPTKEKKTILVEWLGNIAIPVQFPEDNNRDIE